jgi:hypothetical protein
MAVRGIPHGDGSRAMKTVGLQEAIAMIPESATVMIGGFMGVGTLSA